jgi:hypothetical protein
MYVCMCPVSCSLSYVWIMLGCVHAACHAVYEESGQARCKATGKSYQKASDLNTHAALLVAVQTSKCACMNNVCMMYECMYVCMYDVYIHSETFSVNHCESVLSMISLLFMLCYLQHRALVLSELLRGCWSHAHWARLSSLKRIEEEYCDTFRHCQSIRIQHLAIGSDRRYP